jgi:hypothetical protein
MTRASDSRATRRCSWRGESGRRRRRGRRYAEAAMGAAGCCRNCDAGQGGGLGPVRQGGHREHKVTESACMCAQVAGSLLLQSVQQPHRLYIHEAVSERAANTHVIAVPHLALLLAGAKDGYPLRTSQLPCTVTFLVAVKDPL